MVIALDLRLPQADCDGGAAEVPDRLAALALDLRDPVVAERREQLAVERQAALERRHVAAATCSADSAEFLRRARARARSGPPGAPAPDRSPARSAAAAARPPRP